MLPFLLSEMIDVVPLSEVLDLVFFKVGCSVDLSVSLVSISYTPFEASRFCFFFEIVSKIAVFARL